MESIKKYIAEFIGTGVLVVGGCGTAETGMELKKSEKDALR